MAETEKNKVLIAPSVVSFDFSNMDTELKRLEKSGADWFHLDVMDGMFVPNLTFGPPIIKALRNSSKIFFDAHLMVEEPIRYIDDYVKAGSDGITVHHEACKDLGKTLETIKSAGVKVGLAINPDTPVESIKGYLGILDLVLVMSVFPGFSGQKFIESVVPKLTELKNLKASEGHHYRIQIDGGVSSENAASLIEAGADVLVSASYIVKNADDDGLYLRAIESLRG